MKHAERSFVKDKQFPDDVQMLFCIGAQKAGTTWLFHLLRQSKHIHFTKNKELHYFDVIYGKANQLHEARINAVKMLAHKLGNEIGAYNDNHLDALIDLSQLLRIYSNHDGDHQAYVSYLLNDHSDQDVIADITPAYAILDRAGFTEMGRIGCAKFIFILRDPVDRMWSQIRMAVGSQHRQVESFQQACAQRARHLIAINRLANIERGNYQRTIEELESAIPLDRIKYIFYENLFSDNTIFDICEFIGVPALFAQFETRQNVGIEAVLPEDLRLEFKRALQPQYTYCREKFGATLPPSWRKALEPCLSFKSDAINS